MIINKLNEATYQITEVTYEITSVLFSKYTPNIAELINKILEKKSFFEISFNLANSLVNGERKYFLSANVKKEDIFYYIPTNDDGDDKYKDMIKYFDETLAIGYLEIPEDIDFSKIKHVSGKIIGLNKNVSIDRKKMITFFSEEDKETDEYVYEVTFEIEN